VIRGIHHTSISTGDIERSLAFYRDLLGFEVVMDYRWPVGTRNMDVTTAIEGTSGRAIMLRASNAMLELMEYATPAPASGDPARPLCDHGITHLCLEVDDIEREYQRLTKAGMRFHHAPVQNDGAKATYGRDPDGNAVELIEFQRAEEPLALAAGAKHGG
jgi:catechol 2,3-dioxygenase-like lactoylglutathione lyase family enzyme